MNNMALADPDSVTVHPEDTGAAPTNPGMGWTLHYYSNVLSNYGSRLDPSDTLDDFPGLSVIYLRLPWSMLEPQEGRFNWSLLDTPAQRWIDKGKQIALRITCSESWMRWATPPWVHDAGAKGTNFNFGKGPAPDGKLWQPDYLDPIFLEKLDHFLAALARRYDGNPNVAFVDIGSFGMWGEGHTIFTTSLNQQQTDRIVKTHIDLYQKHFTRTLLVLNDDAAGHDNTSGRYPIMDYALSKGVTMRDDSILVQPPPHHWFHADMAQRFWPTLPVILENEHVGPSIEKHAWDPDLFVQAIEDYHASYMSIHWWPREFLRDHRPLIDRVNRRLGYRIVPRRVTWPKQVPLGGTLKIEADWVNTGVAPCYAGGYPAVTLKDGNGGIVGVFVDEAFDVRDLPVAAPGHAQPKTQRSAFPVAMRHIDPLGRFAPNTEPGTYTLFLSVGRPDGTPTIALPLPTDDTHHRYPLGPISITKP
jgi:hypothetical protein